MTPHARDEFIRNRTGTLVTVLLQRMPEISFAAIREQTVELVQTAHGIALAIAECVAPLDLEPNPLMSPPANSEEPDRGHTVTSKDKYNDSDYQ